MDQTKLTLPTIEDEMTDSEKKQTIFRNDTYLRDFNDENRLEIDLGSQSIFVKQLLRESSEGSDEFDTKDEINFKKNFKINPSGIIKKDDLKNDMKNLCFSSNHGNTSSKSFNAETRVEEALEESSKKRNSFIRKKNLEFSSAKKGSVASEIKRNSFFLQDHKKDESARAPIKTASEIKVATPAKKSIKEIFSKFFK